MRKRIVAMGLLMTALTVLVFVGDQAVASPDVTAGATTGESSPSSERRAKIAEARDARLHALLAEDEKKARQMLERIAEDEAEAERSDDAIQRAKVAAGANANARLSLDLIPNGGSGNQRNDAVTSGTVSGQGTKIAIEVFATGVTTALVGMQIGFDFDATLLTFDKAENSAFTLPIRASTGTDFAATPPVTLLSSGFLTRAEFTTATNVTGREFSIGIASVTLSESSSSSDTLTTTNRIEFNATTARTPDFDGNGTVGFSDFMAFAEQYRSRRGDGRYQVRYDLNRDGAIDFSDFLIFIGSYDGPVSPPGGGSSRPDLIVESPSVSDSTLTPGQSFTLRATVRNSGTGSATATTLRYYRSSNSTISTSDTEVGKDSVSGLSASNTSAELISLRAPSSAGTYYYGACVASVSEESNTDNNCSDGVRVTVSSGSGGGTSKMYWTDDGTGKIQRANFDGSNVEDLITTGLVWPRGIALDVGRGKMYWMDGFTDKIQRANLDGSNVEDLITTGLRSPGGIALDVGRGKMYWMDGFTDKIQRANLDGSNVEDLITTGLRSPGGIALDVGRGKMYWTDDGTDKIQRANLNGSNVEDLITTGLVWPRGIALDVGRGKMYWMDGFTDKIQRANLNGSNVEDLITTGLTAPVGIALDIARGKMYWVEQGTDKIQRANLNGSNVEDLVTTGLDRPFGIALDTSGSISSGGGGGSSRPDLIVQSPSVSDNTLTTGQSFTLRATVRNSGTGRSASTTLRYYRSSNSTISTSNTQVGTDNVSGLSASATSSESISLTAPLSSGTYYYGACVASVSGESNANNNCSTGVRVTVSSGNGGGGSSRPDLIVQSPSVSDNTLTTGQSFTLRATVRNSGTGRSASTTLRYYRSSNSTIATSDTEVGTDSVSGLSASGTSAESISLRAPSSAGTYYYGACVASVSGESNANNNCSTGVRVTVSSGSGGGGSSRPDLIVQSPSVSDNTLTTGQSFTLRATVRNSGTGRSASTTLRYYRSLNSTISTSDTEVGTDSVSGLSASGTSSESISLTAPSSSGTYYYGACVASVSGESNTGNNCSTGVRVTVSGSTPPPPTGSLGACSAGMVVRPNQSCRIGGGEFRNVGGGCFVYIPFSSIRICVGSLNVNGFRVTRVGNDYRIDAVP